MTINTSPLLTSSLASSSPYVLIVDDHEASLEALRLVVESAGHDCVAAPSAPDALAYCDRRRPSLVVTDLVMPILDGQGLARWIKARYPNVPILLITGEDLDPATLDRLRSTFSAVLPKPVAIERFLDLLQDLLPD
jgi:CheY-like chemotaxis protein